MKWKTRAAAAVIGLTLAAVAQATVWVPTSLADTGVTVPAAGVPDPTVPDPSILPTADDALDLAGAKCANGVFSNVAHSHAMNAIDPITGKLAYTWNSTIYVSKQCNHPAQIVKITGDATNVDTADGYQFDGVEELVIDTGAVTAHATGQFSYFPVRADNPCPPTTDGCGGNIEIANTSHPTIRWTITVRGDATAEEQTDGTCPLNLTCV